jgi:CHAD domain-containing protein
MNVDVQNAIKPLRKLHELLKDFPVHPTPEEIHELRTRERRLEAIVHTFSSESDRDALRLLKLIKPVRKAAGRVRDMDVFAVRLHEIQIDPGTRGLVRLTEHVARVRDKQVARLHQAIARRGKRARRCIRQYLRTLEARGGHISMATQQVLAAELDNWPRLHAGNLHQFRIRAKELRYMLQLVPGIDRRRMDALDQAKNVAGDWHDWLELHNLAKEILDPGSDRQILQQISAMKRDKLRAGLNAVNRLRKLSVDIPRAA